jgi:hypothetical protein
LIIVDLALQEVLREKEEGKGERLTPGMEERRKRGRE